MNNPRIFDAALIALTILATTTLLLGQDGHESSPANPRDAYEVREVARSDSSGGTFAYRLLSPSNVEPGRLYPLVLFLHGAGERGGDNKAQLNYFPEWMASPEMREAYPCYILAPQCPDGDAWSHISWRSVEAKPLDLGPTDPMLATLDALKDVVHNEPIDIRRVYLTGLSMGGFGSWDLAMRHPDWFAALIPICGGGVIAEAHRITDVPTWAFHGASDNVVPTQLTRDMVKAIEEAGGSPRYTEYEGVGHDSWTATYTDRDVLTWMFMQVNSRETTILDP